MLNPLNYYIWDLETYPNIFTFAGKFRGSPDVQVFELSSRKNQRSELLSWLSYLQNAKQYMVGFNSLNFDYPIIHELLNQPYTFDSNKAYQKAQEIIHTQKQGFSSIRLSDRILDQIDLLKINHFDNKAKYTSLKALQFAMRSLSVEDLPIKPGTNLTNEQMDQLIKYNIHDVTETENFLEKCINLIELRKELLDTKVLSGDVLNFNDTKIGAEYLSSKIGRAKCYQGDKPRQTFRPEVTFKNIILPKIYFRSEPYEQVLDWFNKITVYQSSEERPHLETTLAGLQFHFGLGGVHASVEGKKYEETATHIIKDIDVSGMYVAVAISNGFAPEHLGKEFSDAYKQLQSDRAKYKKGTTMNAVLKLAGNGVYGKSNDIYSCFYDPQYTYTVTANGQLQLLQLVEMLSMIPGLEIIQANTDGITAYFPRDVEPLFNMWCKEWEKMTNLKLEDAYYKKMFIRDVNNYLAVTREGKIKRKGAYWFPENEKDYEGQWHKDFSMMVVQKATEKCLIDGVRPEKIIRAFTNPFDFMMRYKTPAGAKVYIGQKEMLKTVRYYVSTKGEPMKKVSTPKGDIGAWKRKSSLTDSYFNKIMSEIPQGAWDERIHTKSKGKYEMVETSVESGRLVKECNVATDFDFKDVDYDYYIEEVKKLLIGAQNV